MGRIPRGNRKKTTRAHTTAIRAVERLLTPLNRWTGVEKITLGVIKPNLRSAPRRIKIVPLNDKVLRIKVRDANAVQEIKVTTSDVEQTTKDIVAFAEKKGWEVT